MAAMQARFSIRDYLSLEESNMNRFSGRTRYSALALLLLLVLLVSACGAEATATPGTAGGTGSTTATDTPAASAGGAATDTPAAPGGSTTDTPAAGGSAPSTGGGATPVSDWRPGSKANSVPAPSKLVAGGTLTVGSDAGYPPQEYIGADGKAVGLDIDIADEIASRMGLKLNVINFKFDDIIPALKAGQFDTVVSAMTITDERKKVVDFIPYFDAGQAVLVKKGNPKGIKALED